jgi:uncharacterized protein (TIGR02145 family)
MGMFFGQNQLGGSPPTPVVSNIKYGRLYNWYAASNPLFAPAGWHVPSNTEFNALSTELGGNSVSGGKLKEAGLTYWNDPNIADNTSGFSARADGDRNASDGVFRNMLVYAKFWTATQFPSPTTSGYEIMLLPGDDNYYINGNNKKFGDNIRLIKDDSTDPGFLEDIDGNIYRTVKIGTQVWLAGNWACTKLRDGTPIPNVTNGTTWSGLTTEAYCNYNNDITNVFLP